MRTGCSTPDGNPLTIRCGAAQLERGMDGRELLDRADLQLLAAKGQPATSPPGAA